MASRFTVNDIVLHSAGSEFEFVYAHEYDALEAKLQAAQEREEHVFRKMRNWKKHIEENLESGCNHDHTLRIIGVELLEALQQHEGGGEDG